MHKPNLLVTSPDPNPHRGSEPGKAFHWIKALTKHYQVHLVCLPEAFEVCAKSGLCEDWVFHPLDTDRKGSAGFRFYAFYYEWCRRLIPTCLELIPKIKPVGLHHPTLGSFRILPSYHRLPIPYILGPLGGGETAPLRLLLGASLPMQELAKELCRPALNYGVLLNPQSRRVIREARLVLATTRETERLLRWAGAKDTAVVFPDVLDLTRSISDPLSIRKRQHPELRREFRCVWSGRFLWWKGGQLAVRFLKALLGAGCNASLDIFSDGVGINHLESMARNMKLGERVRFNGMVGRDQLLEAYLRAHLFVYPTLHDSSSSAIPEAYSTGLPSFTLALGGTRTATSPVAGFNETPGDIHTWLEQGVQMVRRWMDSEGDWLKACKAAYEKALTFSPANLAARVEEHLCPCLIPEAPSAK